MKIFFITLSIISIILLLPIPLKITVTFFGKKIHFKIYGKEIHLTPRLKKKIKRTSKKANDKIEEDVIHKDLVNPHNTKKIIDILRRNKFKLSLKLRINLDYSLEDAAHTAIAYGLINQLLSLISVGLNMFFNLKEFKSKINPTYNNFCLNFEVNSIIFINFAKIIYICIIILYNLKFGRKKLKLPTIQYKEEVQNG